MVDELRRAKEDAEDRYNQMQRQKDSIIAELQEQLKKHSANSDMSNAEWIEKLRKKEKEFQDTLR